MHNKYNQHYRLSLQEPQNNKQKLGSKWNIGHRKQLLPNKLQNDLTLIVGSR